MGGSAVAAVRLKTIFFFFFFTVISCYLFPTISHHQILLFTSARNDERSYVPRNQP